MKFFKILWITMLMISFLYCQQNEEVAMENVNPVNPDASAEARGLLQFLYSISGKKTLTGQHNMLGLMSQASENIAKITGQAPAVWGSDFGFADSTHDIDNIAYRPLLVEEIKKQHAVGSIITMTYHQANPAIGEPCPFQGGVISKLSDEQWRDLLTPGTQLCEAWRQQMDLFAGYLKQLRDAHIPILFRPYHEMNGDWFWWCGRKGERGVIALWKQLFRYYTGQHQLNNLIWVWSPDKPKYGLAEFYPGDEFVDVIGCDIYPEKDNPVVFRQEWYEALVALAQAKPLAIGECGVIPSPEILQNQPRWVWFMGWADLVTKRNSAEAIRDVFDSERTLTREELILLRK